MQDLKCFLWVSQLTTETLMNVANNYHDPRTFWVHIKRLKVNKTPTNRHLIVNTNKLIKRKRKRPAGKYRQKRSRSHRRKTRYDVTRNRDLQNYFTNNEDIWMIYNLSDWNMLQGGNNMDSLITTEIHSTIKAFKNIIPGESKIK